jgi:hypothetical protein
MKARSHVWPVHVIDGDSHLLTAPIWANSTTAFSNPYYVGFGWMHENDEKVAS